jgi:hypothetical protein
MKTYLSRLVARAQPPAVPVVTASRPAPGPMAENPFEQTAPFVPTPASPIATTAAPRPAMLAPPGSTNESKHAAIPAPSAVLSEKSTTFRHPLLPPLVAPAATAAVVATASVPLGTVPPPADRPRRTSVPTTEPMGILKAEVDPVLARATTFREIIDEKPLPLSDAPVRASASAASIAPAEEARLQELADTFMARLSPRTESLLASISSSAGPPPASTEAPLRGAIPAATTAARFQPATPEPVTPPQPAPSVIIGRLSVEVVPASAPTRPPPSTSRAVPRRAIYHPLPTPRALARFGLGQL